MSITFARFSKSGMAKDQQIMRSCKVWKSRDKLELNQLFSSWWCSDSSPFSQKSPLFCGKICGGKIPLSTWSCRCRSEKRSIGEVLVLGFSMSLSQPSWACMLRHEQVTQTLLGQCILVFGSVDGWKGFIYFYFFWGGVDIWTCRSYQLTNIWGSICKAIS